MRRDNEKPTDHTKITLNFIEFMLEDWGIDSKKLAPGLQKDFKEFNYGRYMIIGGILLILFLGGLEGFVIGGALIYFGYKQCAKIYPRLKDDLAFYKSMHKNDP